ncbi:PrsW family intramembrane metalloprotease [Streptomyces polygonati]|uniref:PrsW family intramembrane metalloprotease n=1 Tax=Streptomyces polygonati TaxID=1617087 RepID=A0ABV8HXX3_9ACTN
MTPPPAGAPDESVVVAAASKTTKATKASALKRCIPRRAFWESKAVRTVALFTALAVCGVTILALVRQHIGTEPFLIGLLLAILPVPLLLWAFLWLDQVAPNPWQNVVFAVAWGACAATLVAIFGNEYGEKLISSAFSGTPSQSDHWGAMFVAPLVEETAKGSAILLLFLFRRRTIESIVDGIVLGGLVATGFAFTENILYLGTAAGEDRDLGSPVLGATTVGTFFVRVLMTPFAHPLFTSMTGIGFAIAATARPGRHWRWRWAPPVGGWMLAMLLHGTWNGCSLTSPGTFLTVYLAAMLPACGLVVWLAFWARSNELRTIRTHLAVYAAAGWLAPPEPAALGSMSVRATARRETRRFWGEAPSRAVRDYTAFATHLAFLRAAATRGAPAPDFAARESELLHHLWSRKSWAQPALLSASQPTRPPYFPPPPRPGQWGPGAYRTPYAYPYPYPWAGAGAGAGTGAPGKRL